MDICVMIFYGTDYAYNIYEPKYMISNICFWSNISISNTMFAYIEDKQIKKIQSLKMKFVVEN